MTPLILLLVLVGQSSADSRTTRLVTLDSHFPFALHKDVTAWEERANQVRRQILVAAGLWPMPDRPPIAATVHGCIDRGDYVVRKVFFESLPGFYVTGNLYEPTAPAYAPRPAVLSPHGHFTNGRLARRDDAGVAEQIENGSEPDEARARYHIQARLAQLARLGCVVFQYDMVGFADSRQIEHGEGFADVEAELWQQSCFGLQTFNSIRALDFLESCPGVDRERIGVTGASGGGTQTFILCAIDPRPAAACPAVMVSTGMQGGCVCENASHLRIDTGNVEFAALFAPRPLMMTGANDWTLAIESDGLPELKVLYGAYGVPWRVHAVCHPEFEHNYNLISREHMYSWFDTYLNFGAKLPIREAAFEPVPPAELSVFDADYPLPENAVDAAGLRQVWRSIAEGQLATLTPENDESLAEFRRVVGGALEVLLHTALPARGGVAAELVATEERDGYSIERVRLSRFGAGEAVPANLTIPAAWNGAVVVDVNGALAPGAVVEHGAAHLAVAPLLSGAEHGPGAALPVDERRHTDSVGYTFGYNRTLLAWRVHDVLTAVAFARDLEGTTSIRLLGLGDAGPWVVLARALAGDAVDLVAADWGFDFERVSSFDDPRFLPGALRYGGMPSFAALCAPWPLVLLGAVDAPETVRQAYRAAGRPEAVRALEAPDAALLARELCTR